MAFSIFGFTFGQNKSRAEHPYRGFAFETNRNKKVLDKNFYDWYKENPFVFNAVEERGKAIGNAKFYYLKNGERTENEVTKRLNSPNKYQSQQDFLRQDIALMSIFGTGYYYINKLLPSSSIDKSEIYNLNAEELIFTDERDNILQADIVYNEIIFTPKQVKIWLYNKVTDKKTLLNKENLLPFFDTSTFTNPYFSQSRLESLQYIVSNSQAALESQNTFLSNPGGIGMIVSRKKSEVLGSIPLTEEERSDIERSTQNDYGTLSHQKNIQIVGHDVDYVSTIPKVADLKLNDTLVQMGLVIFGAFGLPKECFTALADGSTFENQKEAYKRYLQSDAQNIIDNRVNSLNTYFGYNGEDKIIASFDHLPIMQSVLNEKITTFKLMQETIKLGVENSTITANEAKQMTDSLKLKLGL